MMNRSILYCVVFAAGRMSAQDSQPAVAPIAEQGSQTAYQILSESTVQQKDGSSITFRQVVPPVVAPQVQTVAATSPPLTAAQEAALSQMPAKETGMLSISASVNAGGFTVLRWTSGPSQRLHAVSNVDFRLLAGLGSLETEQASYFLILSAGLDDQPMTNEEVQASRLLPVNGAASFALVGSDTTVLTSSSPAEAAALDAMDSLLNYFDAHKVGLMQQYAQREAERAARELAARNAPPPPPRRSIIHFWPLQPAQRAAIQESTQRGEAAKQPRGVSLPSGWPCSQWG